MVILSRNLGIYTGHSFWNLVISLYGARENREEEECVSLTV